MITLLSVTAFVYFALILICFVDGMVTLWMTSTKASQPTPKPTAQPLAESREKPLAGSREKPFTPLAEDPWTAAVIEPLILLPETRKPPQRLLALPPAPLALNQEPVKVPTIRELKEKAKAKKIKNYSRFTKAQLLEALTA